MTPRVSVVLGVFEGAAVLDETLASIAVQTLGDFECIVVDDGSTDPRVAEQLADWVRRDARFRVIRQPNQGLTRALIAGCAEARGPFIARIDVGDTMAPERLAEQAAVLERYPDCAFAAVRTQFHGPAWEPLHVNAGLGPWPVPGSILPAAADAGLEGDIPHHGSVMMRRAACEQVGGYRAEFYYGQDWDLWYRLAEVGTFAMVPRVLYHARLFPEAISMTHAERQRSVAACSLGAFQARRRGEDERPWLRQAAAVRPQAKSAAQGGRRGHEPGYYFIGEALRRVGDPACRTYLARAIRERPSSLRAWVRLVQAVRLARPVERGEAAR